MQSTAMSHRQAKRARQEARKGEGVPRRPNAPIRRLLRQEVAFGCPVEGCGNPYLTYHHFDPPFHVRPHNNPDGIIALCHEHHDKERAWTIDDFRAMKRAGYRRNSIQGRFEWMKRDILTIAGGNAYYKNSAAEITSTRFGPLLWYNRDEQNRLLLNLRMLHTAASTGTVLLEDNDWTVLGAPLDVESPPNGSFLSVSFPSGDKMSIQFSEQESSAHICDEYGFDAGRLDQICAFPIVTAEVTMAVGGTDLKFGPHASRLPGNTVVSSAILAFNTYGWVIP